MFINKNTSLTFWLLNHAKCLAYFLWRHITVTNMSDKKKENEWGMSQNYFLWYWTLFHKFCWQSFTFTNVLMKIIHEAKQEVKWSFVYNHVCLKKGYIYSFKILQNQCLTIYLCMFPLVVNVWPHITHLYGLSPLWTSMWRSRELAELKAFPQILQEWSVPPLSVLCWRLNKAQMSIHWYIVYI